MSEDISFFVSKQVTQTMVLRSKGQEEQPQTLSSKGPEPNPPTIAPWMVWVSIFAMLFSIVVLLLKTPSATQNAGDHAHQVIDQSINVNPSIFPHPYKTIDQEKKR